MRRHVQSVWNVVLMVMAAIAGVVAVIGAAVFLALLSLYAVSAL